MRGGGTTEAARWSMVNVVLLVLLLLVFVISLPGLGIETRTTSQYAAWAGPVFLVLTLLVFIFGVASLVTTRRRVRVSAFLAIGAGVVAITTNLFDFSHVGGPAPPPGPFILGMIAIVVALGLLMGGSMILRSHSSAPPA